MYEIGTILKVVYGGYGAEGANNCIVEVVDKYVESEHGLMKRDERFLAKVIDICETNYAKIDSVWGLSPDGRYEIIK